MIIDTRDFSAGQTIRSDVCIVGGGVAGITMARSLRSAGLSVSLLESGGTAFDVQTQSLYAGRTEGTLFPDGSRGNYSSWRESRTGKVCAGGEYSSWRESRTGEVACGGRFRSFHTGATGQVCLGGLFDGVVLDPTSPLVQASPSSELSSATSERTEPSDISRPTTTRPPANARVAGNQWYCNSGFRRVDNECVALSVLYCPRVLGQWFDGIRFYAAASSPRRSRRTWAGLR